MNIFARLYRWHPEVALRYLPIASQIKNRGLSVLEVGSGWLGISPYLGRQVTGLDEHFEAKNFPLLHQVKGNILKIPFNNNGFDAVICVDVLEHLIREQRQKAIKELLRVAKKNIYIAVPCGQASDEQDKVLDSLYRKRFGRQFPYLSEHLKYGLPQKDEILKSIYSASEAAGKKVKIVSRGNEGLGLRYFLMKGWMTKNVITDFIFRKVMLLLIPFFIAFDKPPYYRQLFFVTIES